MIPDGTYTAEEDRIGDDVVTLLLEEDDRDAYELDVDMGVLTTEARHADSILSVEISDSKLGATTYEPEATETRQETTQSRFDRLAECPPQADEENS